MTHFVQSLCTICSLNKITVYIGLRVKLLGLHLYTANPLKLTDMDKNV